MTIRGIDVSAVQGNLGLGDWRAIVQSGIRFASIKCGNGNNPPDPRFRANLAAAKAVGLVVQAYHVGFPFHPDPLHPGREPQMQARAHFAQSSGLGTGAGEIACALDLEYPEPKDWATLPADHGGPIDAAFIAAWTEAYLAEMATLCGRLPYLYLYPDYLHHFAAGADLTPLARYPLWAAEYGVASPYVLPPWTGCAFWQRSGGGGRLPNGEPVDEDVFEGDEAAFASAANRVADVTDHGNDLPVHPPVDTEAT